MCANRRKKANSVASEIGRSKVRISFGSSGVNYELFYAFMQALKDHAHIYVHTGVKCILNMNFAPWGEHWHPTGVVCPLAKR
jgi:hypothetical protein